MVVIWLPFGCHLVDTVKVSIGKLRQGKASVQNCFASTREDSMSIKKQVEELLTYLQQKHITGIDIRYPYSLYNFLEENKRTDIDVFDYCDFVCETVKDRKAKNLGALFNFISLKKETLNKYDASKKQKVVSPQKLNLDSVECPVCHTRFSRYEGYCSICSLSYDAIKNNDEQALNITKKIFHMTEDEKNKYEEAFHNRVEEIKRKTNRPFLLPEEQLQFYKDYGILA